MSEGHAVFNVPLAIALWGYDLRGRDVLEVTARIAEGGDDLNGPPLWDHPEWLDGWYRDGEPWTPPFHRALPYAPDGPWNAKSAP